MQLWYVSDVVLFALIGQGDSTCIRSNICIMKCNELHNLKQRAIYCLDDGDALRNALKLQGTSIPMRYIAAFLTYICNHTENKELHISLNCSPDLQDYGVFLLVDTFAILRNSVIRIHSLWTTSMISVRDWGRSFPRKIFSPILEFLKNTPFS